MKHTLCLADSGSTKTDWMIVVDDHMHCRFQTSGLNPSLSDDDGLMKIFDEEFLTCCGSRLDVHSVDTVRFFGAGCRGDAACRMSNLLHRVMPNAGVVEVESDMLGAARMLCGDKPGIVCILGTGSNSCYYDGNEIQSNVSPLGYILGDEGSGAVLGRRLIGDVFKRQLSPELCKSFHEDYPCSLDEIIGKVYRGPAPNRFLASFTYFLSKNIQSKEIQEIVEDEFRKFIRRNVSSYQYRNLPLHFTGSIAWYFHEQLQKVVEQEGYLIADIVKQPLDTFLRTGK